MTSIFIALCFLIVYTNVLIRVLKSKQKCEIVQPKDAIESIVEYLFNEGVTIEGKEYFCILEADLFKDEYADELRRVLNNCFEANSYTSVNMKW